MNKKDTLKQICKMIASGEIPDEVYDKYLSKTPIGFMNYNDLYKFLKEATPTQEQLRKENNGLKEQVAYLRRSCERKEETIVEQQQELVGLDIKIDKMIEDINFCLHSIKQEMKISKDERTRSEITNCYKILSVYEKGEKND